jgi:NADH:ubiquinone oxidoreductase subunit K
LEFLLITAISIFVTGFVNSIKCINKNLLSFLVSIEIALLGLNLLFIISSYMYLDIQFLFITLIIIIIGVVDSSIGLSICLLLLKRLKNNNIKQF